MGILHAIFGPSRDEIWKKVAKDIGGEYIEGGFWDKDVLLYHSGPWTLALDTYTVSSGDSSTTYTRLRVPFLNKDELKFTVYESNIFSGIGKFFGMQDLEIGSPVFDENYIVKGNDPLKIQKIFRGDKIQDLMSRIPGISLTLEHDEGWLFQKHPKGVHVLSLKIARTVKDTIQLKCMFLLFVHILDRLVYLDSAYQTDPNYSFS